MQIVWTYAAVIDLEQISDYILRKTPGWQPPLFGVF
jgi:hypothetical protein